MAKKSKMSMGKMIMTIIAIVLAAATCIPLFVNVWNTVYYGALSGTTVEAAGGYFTDFTNTAKWFNNINTESSVLPTWASMVAGIALCVALFGALLYILGAIANMVKVNKTMLSVQKIGSVIMLLAGLVILVTSIIFVIPTSAVIVGEKTIESLSMSLGLGAWIGIIAPLAAGLIGMIASKE